MKNPAVMPNTSNAVIAAVIPIACQPLEVAFRGPGEVAVVSLMAVVVTIGVVLVGGGDVVDIGATVVKVPIVHVLSSVPKCERTRQ